MTGMLVAGNAARHIDALEARLGAMPVRRATRRLLLTEGGSVAVEGLLRVSVPATFGVLHIAPMVAAFRALHPGVMDSVQGRGRVMSVKSNIPTAFISKMLGGQQYLRDSSLIRIIFNNLPISDSTDPF
jgi:DNA-binding transcriptional LysR family regulator